MTQLTKEEAIKKLNAIKKYLTAGNPIWDVKEIDEVLDVAVEALQAKTDGDLISRADAIEAIQNAYCKPCKERGDDHNGVRCRACEFDDAIIQIDALPSAEANDITDLVSRQAVLDKAYAYGNGLQPEGFCVDVEDIQALPSAQPERSEIIRCKNCRHDNNCECGSAERREEREVEE